MQDRVVVITGATGNLGRVMAAKLAESGAALALFGTNEERLHRLEEELGVQGDRMLTGVTDFTQPGGAEASLGAVMGKYGRVDILLHLVGGWTGGKTVTEVPPEDLAGMLGQHVWTTFYLAKAFVPHLVENGWGRIVVVSSPHASNPPAKSSPYVAAKAAQEALILGLSKELAGSGVTANIVQVHSIDADHERDRERTTRNALWTTPEELAGAILYLCSDEAGVINGARIPVFGG
ncbi:MAG: SDR family NAD(P)-dependent oxidoreductase [Chloroflexia bacterium]